MTHDLLTRLDEIVTLCCKADDDDACETIREAQALIRGLMEVERAAREREAEDARFDGQPEEKRRAWHLGDVQGRFEARLKLQDALLALAALDKKGE